MRNRPEHYAERKVRLCTLDPKGEMHIVIGCPDSVDTLKTFIEPEGCFSPGVASFGVYFWIFDNTTRMFYAPTLNTPPPQRGLSDEGYLIPWSEWEAGCCRIRSEYCQTKIAQNEYLGVRIDCTASCPRSIRLYIAIRPMGPAGWPIHNLEIIDRQIVLIDGKPVLICTPQADAAGALAEDRIGEFAMRGTAPPAQSAQSAGTCSGALVYNLSIAPGNHAKIELLAPILPGRHAAPHDWDDHSWFRQDRADLSPENRKGVKQPIPSISECRSLSFARLRAQSHSEWRQFCGSSRLQAPDIHWRQASNAIPAHIGMCFNDGELDLAVMTINRFTRDAVFMVHCLQMKGCFEWSRKAIARILEKPFGGRVKPEADNPGQVLWLLHQHWLLTRDNNWLEYVYPHANKLARLIHYARTAPEPHWIEENGNFADAASPHTRKKLEPGACDGYHPEYTEAFDIAGLRAAAQLAAIAEDKHAQTEFDQLADRLLEQYHQRYGHDLAKDYGKYCVLWPCRLYPLDTGPGHDCFHAQPLLPLVKWRYFPLLSAHQSLLAGNRTAGHQTIANYLAEEQMRGWFLLDEGGPSGLGAWPSILTTWSWNMNREGFPASGCAMPDGWGLAELWLLMRDSLFFEDGGKLILLAGVSPDWFFCTDPIEIFHMPTWFGPCTWTYQAQNAGAILTISEGAPPHGYILRFPAQLAGEAVIDGKHAITFQGDLSLPSSTREARIAFDPKTIQGVRG